MRFWLSYSLSRVLLSDLYHVMGRMKTRCVPLISNESLSAVSSALVVCRVQWRYVGVGSCPQADL